MMDTVRNVMDKVLSTIAATLFLVAVFSTALGVVDRTFGLNLGTVWADELTRYAMIWAVMMLIGIGIRKGTQIRLTLLANKLSKRNEDILNIIVMLLVIFLFGILMIYGVRTAFNNRVQISPVMQISMFYPLLAIPFSAFFVVLESSMIIYEAVRSMITRGGKVKL